MTKSLSKYLSGYSLQDIVSSLGSERRTLSGLNNLGVGENGQIIQILYGLEGIIEGIKLASMLPGLVIPLM